MLSFPHLIFRLPCASYGMLHTCECYHRETQPSEKAAKSKVTWFSFVFLYFVTSHMDCVCSAVNQGTIDNFFRLINTRKLFVTHLCCRMTVGQLEAVGSILSNGCSHYTITHHWQFCLGRTRFDVEFPPGYFGRTLRVIRFRRRWRVVGWLIHALATTHDYPTQSFCRSQVRISRQARRTR